MYYATYTYTYIIIIMDTDKSLYFELNFILNNSYLNSSYYG